MQVSMSQPAAVARRTPPRVRPPGEIFAGYALDSAYDEMFDASGQARPDCRALFEDLVAASLPQLRQRQTEADKAFLTQGITFTVYGDGQAPSASSRTTCCRASSPRTNGA